jgi:hypothetical protein
VFVGYIDESHDDAAVPKVFNLSCLVSSVAGWLYFEWDWLEVLKWKNNELRRRGRQEISRVHASPLNNFRGEFAGWTPDERLEFSIKLTEVFKRNPVHIHGWDMPLQILVEEFPEFAPNPVGFAYIVLLMELMQQIGDTTLSLPNYKDEIISLHHDHCDYDAALAQQFSYILNDQSFSFRHRFTSLTPEYWQYCVPLQPADLVAFENYKEGMRFHVPESKEAKRGQPRQSLTALIDLKSISGRARGFTRELIKELKNKIEGFDEDAKKTLFGMLRIPYVNEAEKFDATRC